MDPVGSVCIEVLENPMQLEITVTAKDDYSLVKSSLWVGEDASLIPEDDTGIPDYPNFPYTWTNTNEETSWKSLVLVNRSSKCNVDMTDFV
ncbi:expressed unknown protein [Seminavis robusta]|uniref:Uncharacterized protein n=1 Tax=Seminavis robusta TaxID=568900 RepID=A0A9N8DGY5_9STRA|nr:expressed unknown protein [Seminavis robusta]|eukprot:Sro115_g056680.1 n/a (91) ;mRNA; f:33962-34234